jgi:hypothetical protein
MIRTLAFSIALASTAHAGLIESDWSPNQGEHGGQLVFDGDRLHMTGPAAGASASRTWTKQLTLDSDLSIQARVHLRSMWEYSSVGFSLSPVGDPFEVAALELRHSQIFGRFVTMHHRTGPLNGSSVDKPFTGTDAVLRMAYSASEGLMRSYYQPLGGEPVEVYATSVNNWGVATSDLLTLNVFGTANSAITVGETYFENFIFVPEPATALWLCLVPMLNGTYGTKSDRSGPI